MCSIRQGSVDWVPSNKLFRDVFSPKSNFLLIYFPFFKSALKFLLLPLLTVLVISLLFVNRSAHLYCDFLICFQGFLCRLVYSILYLYIHTSCLITSQLLDTANAVFNINLSFDRFFKSFAAYSARQL